MLRRRRRVAGAVLATVVAGLLAGLELAVTGSIPVGGRVAESRAEPAVPPQCADDSREAMRARLGARLVVRMEADATPELLRQARRGEIGGVILFPPLGVEPRALRGEIAKLQRAARAGEAEPEGAAPAPSLLVAIDQEGGEVKRLPSEPPDLSPPQIAAREAGARGSGAGDAGAAVAQAQGLATGTRLAAIGVNVDLAPVLDVPAVPGSFIASRAYGEDPARVAELGTAFAGGLAEGGVAATAKHFPGLGRASANTDFAPGEVSGGERLLRADLEPFEAAIGAGVPLVMLSSATYPALDDRVPAFASPRIADELLRGELGFAGVTITDDLGSAAVTALYEPGQAARAAAEGGSDLLLYARTSSPGVLDSLVRMAENDRFDAAALEQSCIRVSALRQGLQPLD